MPFYLVAGVYAREGRACPCTATVLAASEEAAIATFKKNLADDAVPLYPDSMIYVTPLEEIMQNAAYLVEMSRRQP